MEPELQQHLSHECKQPIRFTPKPAGRAAHSDSSVTIPSFRLGQFEPVCDRQVTSPLSIIVTFQ